MSANLDRPLSDIIDENNKSNPRRGGRGGARRGGAGGQRRNNNNNNNNNKGNRNPLARDDDAQDDQNGGGGGYGPQRRGRMDTRAGPYGDDSWKHDMYGANGPRQLQRPSGIGFKLMVSNLDNAVTNADLQEIFAEIGPIQTVAINTDKEGRPIGTAEITFGSRAEADRALKEFDGAEVDGRPMYLKLVSAPPRVQSVQAAAPAPRHNNNNFSIGSRPQRGGMRSARGGNNQSRPRGGSAGRGRGGAGGRGGRGGRGRQPKEDVTAEALDAEMESYRKSATGTGAAAAPAASS